MQKIYLEFCKCDGVNICLPCQSNSCYREYQYQIYQYCLNFDFLSKVKDNLYPNLFKMVPTFNNFLCETINRRKIISIVEKCNELGDDPDLFIDFIYDLHELEFLNKEELDENERKTFENTYKENIKPFLVCHQLCSKFENEFDYLNVTKQKFAIIFEINKAKSFIKEIKKLELLKAKVTVISKASF